MINRDDHDFIEKVLEDSQHEHVILILQMVEDRLTTLTRCDYDKPWLKKLSNAKDFVFRAIRELRE